VSTDAAVRLWGTQIGAVSLEEDHTDAVFQYDPAFLASGIEVSPLRMPLAPQPYTFPGLNPGAFHGLPGLLADSLPDKFGNAVIDAWLASRGRRPEEFNAVQRLCYIGRRGMGALEFAPARGPRVSRGREIAVDELVALASRILAERESFATSLADGADQEGALRDILAVGTSAGGARAKAVIAYDPHTGAVRSGQIDAEPGFEYWILKFDGVSNNRDRDLEDPQGYGAIEYAYSQMAQRAGIQMSECRILEEHGRRHFMTRRFDRTEDGERLHMQTLAALAHFDFNDPLAYSYEQAFDVVARLGLDMDTKEQLFRRMAFNILARNQDDHVKNIAFLMDRRGRWSLSPAYDVIYAYNPSGGWTRRHQMSMNGKREGFTRADFIACADTVAMSRRHASAILEEVRDAVVQWPAFAREAGVAADRSRAIADAQRLTLAER
jgi:serine/threonine-protein kinase HipA